MKNIVGIFLIALTASVAMTGGTIHAQDEPIAGQIRDMIRNEAFTINLLVQSGFSYSLYDDDFLGGRTFKVENARLTFKGQIDERYYYKILVNMRSEPNLLVAFAGYRHSDALRITTGAMKPSQTADLIIDSYATDFVDRAIITGHLVQAREIGLAAEGDINGFYYYSGIFNGSRLNDNNNNKFYGIGRLQYTFDDVVPGTLQFGVSGSNGDSPGIRSGNAGPLLRGKRSIYGADVRMETGKTLLAAEYLAGNVEMADLPDRKEFISGYYLTGGYRFVEKTMALVRWQSWGYRETDFRDNRLTLGINHDFTGITSLRFNADAYFPDQGDNHYGLSLIFQVYF
ncbi:MAG: porin [Bacteroidales bacterium]